MALHMNRNDQRTQLQEKIAAELRAKAAARSNQIGDQPDGVTDSNYVKDFKSTTSLAWAWLLIGVAAIGLLIYFTIKVWR